MVGPGPAQLEKGKKKGSWAIKLPNLTRLDMLQPEPPQKKVSWAVNLPNQTDSGWTRFSPARMAGPGPAQHIFNSKIIIMIFEYIKIYFKKKKKKFQIIQGAF
jgi:hypothetical protein